MLKKSLRPFIHLQFSSSLETDLKHLFFLTTQRPHRASNSTIRCTFESSSGKQTREVTDARRLAARPYLLVTVAHVALDEVLLLVLARVGVMVVAVVMVMVVVVVVDVGGAGGGGVALAGGARPLVARKVPLELSEVEPGRADGRGVAWRRAQAAHRGALPALRHLAQALDL